MLIINSSYYSNSEIDTPDETTPLLVTSAGHHVLKSLPMFDTTRPMGRKDYQAVYVKSGRLYYQNDDQKHAADAGSILIYHPFTPQFYTYYLEDSPDIYWAHFTGGMVQDRLRRLGLYDQLCYETDTGNNLDEVFNNMIQELQSKSNHFKELCQLYLEQFFFLLSRSIATRNETAEDSHPEIKEIVHLFNARYSEPFNIHRLAHQYNMSASWLTRLFNKQMHMSPQKYLTFVRIEKAKVLLSSTNSVGEIAATVGYSDPLYFSRIFRQMTGLSPTEYRSHGYRFPATPLDKAPWAINDGP